MAARRLEDQAALLERRLSALDAAHGDEARISAAREATLGQLKAMTSEINNQKFLLAPKAAADDEQEGLPRCRWGAVQEQAHSLLRGAAQHPFGQLNKNLSTSSLPPEPATDAVAAWRSSSLASLGQCSIMSKPRAGLSRQQMRLVGRQQVVRRVFDRVASAERLPRDDLAAALREVAEGLEDGGGGALFKMPSSDDVRQWFQKAGLDHVQRGLTCDDFAAACDALLVAGGATALTVSTTRRDATSAPPSATPGTASSMAFALLHRKNDIASSFDFDGEARTGTAAAAEASVAPVSIAAEELGKDAKEQNRRVRRMERIRKNERMRVVAAYEKWQKDEEERKAEEKRVKKEIKKRRIKAGVEGPLPEEEEMLDKVKYKPPPREPPPTPPKPKVHDRLNATPLQRASVLAAAQPEHADPAARVVAAREAAQQTRQRREFTQNLANTLACNMCMVQRHLGQEDVHRKRADLVGAKEEHIDAARTAARAADMRKHVAREKQLNKRQTQAREKRTQFEGAFGETKQQLKSKEQAVRDSRPVLRWKDHTCSIIKPDPELRRRKREATLLSEWRAAVQEERDRVHDLRTSRLEALADAQAVARERSPLAHSRTDVGFVFSEPSVEFSEPGTMVQPHDLSNFSYGQVQPSSLMSATVQAPPAMLSAARLYRPGMLPRPDPPFGSRTERGSSWLTRKTENILHTEDGEVESRSVRLWT